MDKTTVVGRIGRVKLFEGDRPRLCFSLASDRSYKDRSGQKVERTQWYNCTIWGSRAASLSRYMAVGDMTLVEGQASVSTYENRDGEVVASLDLTVEDVTLLPNGRRKEEAPAPAKAAPKRAAKATRAAFDDDDLPFES